MTNIEVKVVDADVRRAEENLNSIGAGLAGRLDNKKIRILILSLREH